MVLSNRKRKLLAVLLTAGLMCSLPGMSALAGSTGVGAAKTAAEQGGPGVVKGAAGAGLRLRIRRAAKRRLRRRNSLGTAVRPRPETQDRLRPTVAHRLKRRNNLRREIRGSRFRSTTAFFSIPRDGRIQSRTIRRFRPPAAAG
ncbi:hypothetical protein [Enterocloster asparagiformis]|uniref:hypothetical protein n=1 Tax=Enterocloster asparagiformis TaxID=333367 RepID=UPI0004AC8B73